MASMISLNPRPHRTLAVCILLILMSPEPSALADTIVFQDPQAQQNGTVVGEDDTSVTVRFSKSVIQSIQRRPGNSPVIDGGKVILEKRDGFHILKIPDHLFQTGSTAAGQDNNGLRQDASPSPSLAPGNQASTIQDQLIEEEMSPLQGTIIWQGRPLRGNVKIVMTKYTGFSFASLQKVYSSGPTPRSQGDDIVFTTRTDDRGHYAFEKVPPGFYRLYWQPAGETDWIHRLREKPDFEVVAGRMNIQNIPAK